MKFLKKLLKDLMFITGNEGGYAWALPVGMAALGYLQGEEQAAQARRQNRAAATQTQFSPWTKMGAGQIKSEGSGGIGGAVQGGLTGASMAQNYQSAQQGQQMNDLRQQNLQMQNNTMKGLNPMYQQDMGQAIQQQRGANQLYSGNYQPKQNTWSSMYGA